MTELLRLEKITKTFPGVIANEQVDLDVQRGEIHALLGENGSGKTTLMNCAYGVYHPTAGRIFWKGEEVKIRQARDAIALGIGMVHQHFMLVDPFTVTENVVLGLPSRREPLIGLAQAEAKIRASSERFHLHIDPQAKIWQLPVGMQQRVEILKALYREAELLILDEPTAVLTPGEVEELFKTIKSLTAHGLSVIFITHKLEEVMAVCDRVTVLRDGRKVDTVKVVETDTRTLARMMVGREVLLSMDKLEQSPGEVVLTVEQISAKDDRDLLAVNNLSFTVRRSEVLGIAGVDGNGQTELADVITGLRRAENGRVTLLGEDVTGARPRQIIEKRVAYIPPDRHKMGLFLGLPIRENLVGKAFWKWPFSRRGLFQRKTIDRFAQEMIDNYGIRTPGPEIQVKLLSGGNQQKVILARELSGNPDLVIAAQPTRGLDIGAIEYVHKQIIAARNNGAAVLLISTELQEILALSDRIAVMYEGEFMGVIPAKEADLHELGEMMAGVRCQPGAEAKP
jgi:simple sugar transport system ATP-binding protein